MPCDIAVCLGPSGETSALEVTNKIIVYRKKAGLWKAVREKKIAPAEWAGLEQLRGALGEIIFFLGECKIFVARWVTGVPYFELEKNHISIWEYEGKPGDFLDYVLYMEEEEREVQENTGSVMLMPVPMEYEKGCYSISIKEIQEGDIGVTSKQVLMPLLKNGVYFTLNVLCNHVPPWLEMELPDRGLNMHANRVGENEILVTITNKTC